jgi:hypothetical protein
MEQMHNVNAIYLLLFKYLQTEVGKNSLVHSIYSNPDPGPVQNQIRQHCAKD